jgi:hypothetical protein
MKRVLSFSEWLTSEVLEAVPHQQYVLFTIPKIIRPYFKYDRKLCICAWKPLKNYLKGASLKGQSRERVIYNSKRGTVIYEPLDWLAAITSHIPDKGTQNVHYYGF